MEFKKDDAGWFIKGLGGGRYWTVESHGKLMYFRMLSCWPAPYPWRDTLRDFAEYQGGP